LRLMEDVSKTYLDMEVILKVHKSNIISTTPHGFPEFPS